MIRAYVGIESNSDEGIVSLNRRVSRQENSRALEMMRELDLYCSFNVLLFDPLATMSGVVQNIDFMERFTEVPFNFCRAEVYAGTPLKQRLSDEGRLKGDYLAWGYEMLDVRAELLFRILSAAFKNRNFKSDGVASMHEKVRFENEVLRHFYPDFWTREGHSELLNLSGRIGLNTTRLLRSAHRFCTQVDLDDWPGVKSFTKEIAHRVNDSDLGFVREIRELRAQMKNRIGITHVCDTRSPSTQGHR